MCNKPRIRVRTISGMLSPKIIESAWQDLISKAHGDISTSKLQYQGLLLAKQYGYLPCAG